LVLVNPARRLFLSIVSFEGGGSSISVSVIEGIAGGVDVSDGRKFLLSDASNAF
jgi:hypothetical protein